MLPERRGELGQKVAVGAGEGEAHGVVVDLLDRDRLAFGDIRWRRRPVVLVEDQVLDVEEDVVGRADALWLGRRLEELGFLWMEEPMEEASLSSYHWLSANLSLSILGPESMAGKHWTRAEWIAKGACDLMRTGVWNVGGIGPALKCAHLAESFGMSCEVHGTGAGNLAVCAAVANATWYERGLLHPFIDYDPPPPYLRRIDDEMDGDGYVHLRPEPGLGQDIRPQLHRRPARLNSAARVRSTPGGAPSRNRSTGRPFSPADRHQD